MKFYLLPCSCSRRIAVSAAQAGGTTRCPGCGAEVVVPRLGDLSRLEVEVAEPTRRPTRDWDSARAVVLAGVVTAVVAAGAAGWLRGRRAGVAPIDEAAIRGRVASAPCDVVHASWLEFERQGIARPPVVEEQRRLRHARALAALEKVAWLAAGAGGLAAAAASIAVMTRRRSSPS